jgi:hypothetical protein
LALAGDTSREVAAAPHVPYLKQQTQDGTARTEFPREKLFSTEDHRKRIATNGHFLFDSFLFHRESIISLLQQ